jgi:hypothetical protein
MPIFRIVSIVSSILQTPYTIIIYIIYIYNNEKKDTRIVNMHTFFKPLIHRGYLFACVLDEILFHRVGL